MQIRELWEWFGSAVRGDLVAGGLVLCLMWVIAPAITAALFAVIFTIVYALSIVGMALVIGYYIRYMRESI